MAIFGVKLEVGRQRDDEYSLWGGKLGQLVAINSSPASTKHSPKVGSIVG